MGSETMKAQSQAFVTEDGTAVKKDEKASNQSIAATTQSEDGSTISSFKSTSSSSSSSTMMSSGGGTMPPMGSMGGMSLMSGGGGMDDMMSKMMSNMGSMQMGSSSSKMSSSSVSSFSSSSSSSSSMMSSGMSSMLGGGSGGMSLPPMRGMEMPGFPSMPCSCGNPLHSHIPCVSEDAQGWGRRRLHGPLCHRLRHLGPAAVQGGQRLQAGAQHATVQPGRYHHQAERADFDHRGGRARGAVQAEACDPRQHRPGRHVLVILL